jgi:hypothetical protein
VTTEKTESEVRDGFQRRQDRNFAGLAAEQDKCHMLATLVRIPELGDRTFIELEMIAAEAAEDPDRQATGGGVIVHGQPLR